MKKDFGYAIGILREQAINDSYDLTWAIKIKDNDIETRQRIRLTILQDAMNYLSKKDENLSHKE